MQNTALFLGQVFGLYFIIIGIAVMIRHKYLLPVIGMFAEEKFDRFFISMVEIIAGLFFLLSFQEWGSFYEGLISLFAWLILLEGILYLFLPDRAVEALISFLNVKAWYVFGGLLSVIIGAYLAGTGFGLF
jgi:hypothetical protein